MTLVILFAFVPLCLRFFYPFPLLVPRAILPFIFVQPLDVRWACGPSHYFSVILWGHRTCLRVFFRFFSPFTGLSVISRGVVQRHPWFSSPVSIIVSAPLDPFFLCFRIDLLNRAFLSTPLTHQFFSPIHLLVHQPSRYCVLPGFLGPCLPCPVPFFCSFPLSFPVFFPKLIE